jgi:glycosyltransferase involved in cell wall biosynthesis
MSIENNSISVIHIATSHTGGAGIAARRLNAELNSIGVDSSFYALSKKGFKPLMNEFELHRTFLQRVAGGISRQVSDRIINQSFFSLVSAPGVSTKWLIKKARAEQSVLHIHNWFNLLTFRQFKIIISSGIPIIITLHDQRFMTGGCHTTLDCSNFRKGCFSCPRVNRLLSLQVRRNNAFFSHLFTTQVLNVRIVAPSKFIQNQAVQSNILKLQDIVFVANDLSSQYVQGIKKCSSERRVGELTLGIASMNNKDWLKGSDIIDSLIKHYGADSSIKFKFLANFGSDYYESFWQSINCLLVPSRGDNSPNVIHEAKIRGIPVIASEVGGIPELLADGFDFKVQHQNLNLSGFIEAIEVMRERELDATQTEEMIGAFKMYSSGSMNRLVASYRNLLAQSL